jgi:hypothetical protein
VSRLTIEQSHSHVEEAVPSFSDLEFSYTSTLEVNPHSTLPLPVSHSEMENVSNGVTPTGQTTTTSSVPKSGFSRTHFWLATVIAVVVIAAVVGGSVGATVARRHST